MSNNDPLSACLSKINNSEKVSKNEVVIYGISTIMKQVLKILQDKEYIGKIEYVENPRGGLAKIELMGHINSCGAIKPRFKVNYNDIDRYEKRFLPAKAFGVLIISTSKGLMTNDEAKEKHLGGRLIGYCY